MRPPGRFVLPPPPRGLPRRLRTWYAVTAAIISAVVAAAAPMCPATDGRGRPMWRVEIVNDGDTVTCRDVEGREVRVRMVGIDAPELDQPGGRAARGALVAKLRGGVVRVAGDARDQHGRLLGTLLIDDRDLNREMVAEGWAWAFTGFAADDELVAVESAARRARRGLWADPQPLSPARWRELHPPRAAPR
ncbi:MAG: thermonuclease family protein [Planctomycetes bacterium]|nr:thermonuclease family protein [Planctomycetota bacterium]